jgi:hypothetical protein
LRSPRTGLGAGPAVPPSGLAVSLLADLADWQRQLVTRSFTRVSVEMLLRDLRHTVPSALGYRLVLVAAPGLPEVSITVVDETQAPDRIRSSITFDLPVAQGLSAAATFYAGIEDAFDELAGLLASSTGFGTAHLRLGGRPQEAVEPGVHGLDDHTRVHHALGVLLARGQSFDQAHRHLLRLAEQHGSLQAGADHLLTAFGA